MIQLEFWNKENGFNLADGTPATVEDIYKEFPFTRNGTVVLEYLPNGNVGAIDDLEILKSIYDINPELNDTDALAAITEARNTPPEPHVDPIEAKLDYFIMVNS